MTAGLVAAAAAALAQLAGARFALDVRGGPVRTPQAKGWNMSDDVIDLSGAEEAERIRERQERERVEEELELIKWWLRGASPATRPRCLRQLDQADQAGGEGH